MRIIAMLFMIILFIFQFTHPASALPLTADLEPKDEVIVEYSKQNDYNISSYRFNHSADNFGFSVGYDPLNTQWNYLDLKIIDSRNTIFVLKYEKVAPVDIYTFSICGKSIATETITVATELALMYEPSNQSGLYFSGELQNWVIRDSLLINYGVRLGLYNIHVITDNEQEKTVAENRNDVYVGLTVHITKNIKLYADWDSTRDIKAGLIYVFK